MPRQLVPRTRNHGTLTENGFKGWVRSLLRAGTLKWRPRNAAISAAFVRDGFSPGTRRRCKLHRCAICGGLFPKSKMKADHIEPVVDPEEGWKGWDSYIERMFCEADGFQAVCSPCHDGKTAEERKVRDSAKARRRSGKKKNTSRRRPGKSPRESVCMGVRRHSRRRPGGVHGL